MAPPSKEGYHDLDSVCEFVTAHLKAESIKLDSADHVELEALALLLTSWLPILTVNEDLRPIIHAALRFLISSPSHFVRTVAIRALDALCRTDECSTDFVSTLLTDTAVEPNATTFDIINCVCETPMARVLSGHSCIEVLWSGLESCESIVAESARCCFRNIISAGCGKILLKDHESNTSMDLALRLTEVVEKCLYSRPTNRSATANAVFLLDIRTTELCNSSDQTFASVFREWSTASINSLIEILASKSSGTNESLQNGRKSIQYGDSSLFYPTWASLSGARDRDAIIGMILSVLLRSPLSSGPNPIPSNLFDKLSHLLLECISPSAGISSWLNINKFCKLLSFHLASWKSATSNELITNFFNQALRAVATPTVSKVAIIAVVNSVYSSAAQTPSYEHSWRFFDSLASELQACRYSQAWEVRDSVIGLFGIFCSNRSISIQECITRFLPPALFMALRDTSEYVRSSAYSALGTCLARKEVWTHLLASDPTLPSTIVGCADSQTSSRVSQAEMVSALLRCDHVLETLSEDAQFPDRLGRLVESLYSDDDWDVRKEAMSVCEAVLETKNSNLCGHTGLRTVLSLALNDESRIVKHASWSLLLSEKSKNSAITSSMLPSIAHEMSVDEICAKLGELAVDVHYNPDDEVYPLAPGIADNDLDCPF